MLWIKNVYRHNFFFIYNVYKKIENYIRFKWSYIPVNILYLSSAFDRCVGRASNTLVVSSAEGYIP